MVKYSPIGAYVAVISCFVACFETKPQYKIVSNSKNSENSAKPTCEQAGEAVSINPYHAPVIDCKSSYYSLFDSTNKQIEERRQAVQYKLKNRVLEKLKEKKLKLFFPTYTALHSSTQPLADSLQNVFAKNNVIVTLDNIPEAQKIYNGKQNGLDVMVFFVVNAGRFYASSEDNKTIYRVDVTSSAEIVDKIMFGPYNLCGSAPAINGSCVFDISSYTTAPFYIYVLPKATAELSKDLISIQNYGFMYEYQFQYVNPPVASIELAKLLPQQVYGTLTWEDLKSPVKQN